MRKTISKAKVKLWLAFLTISNIAFGQGEEQKMNNIIDDVLRWAKIPVVVIIFLLILAGGFSYKKNDGEASKGYFIAAIVLVVVFIIAKGLAVALARNL